MDTTQNNTAILLAAHGAPATDYPPMRVGLLMMLEFAGKRAERVGFLRRWRDSLAEQARTWPRTTDNDPYKVAVDDLAVKLSARLGYRTMVAHNEFCTPTIAEALDQLVAEGARRVIVLPTMLVRGNSHTEVEIQNAVNQAAKSHPTVDIHYAWPFEQARLVSLLADQVSAHLEQASQ